MRNWKGGTKNSLYDHAFRRARGRIREVGYGFGISNHVTAERCDGRFEFAYLDIDTGLNSIEHYVTTYNDRIDEPDETFRVPLTHEEPDYTSANQYATCTIEDSDSAPGIDILATNTTGTGEPNDVVLRLNL